MLGGWEAVSQSCCLFHAQLIGCEVSSLIINDAGVKKCLAEAGLPGSMKPCAETLACEDDGTQAVTKAYRC